MSSRKHTYTFFIIYLAAAIGPFSGNLILPMISVLKSDLFTDVAMIMLSFTLFQIPFAIGQYFSGGLSDVYGRRKLIVGGFLILSVGFAFTPFSTDIWFFIFTRILQGVGFALIGPVLIALIGDLTTKSNRSRYMGFYSSAVRAGIALGPLVGGLLASQWRGLFMAMAIFSLALTVCSYVCLRQIAAGEGGTPGEIVENLRDTLKYRNVVILSGIGFLLFFSYIAVISLTSDGLAVFPYYLDPSSIGLILSTGGFVGVFSSSIAGYLTDRFGKLKIPVIGLIITGFSLIILTLVNTYSQPAFPLAYIQNMLEQISQGSFTGVSWNLLIIQTLLRFGSGGIFINFLIYMTIMGIGISFVWPALLALTQEVVPKENTGASASIFSGTRFLGYALAPVVFTPLYLSIGLDIVFVIGAALTPIIIALTYLVTRKKVEKPEIQKEKEISKPDKK